MTEEILTRVLGLSLLILSAIMLFNKKALKAGLRTLISEELLLVTGFIFTISGIIVISIHNIWEFSWRGMISLVGWLLLAEGIFRLLFMGKIIKTIRNIDSLVPVKISLILTLIIGAYLTFISFFRI